MDFLDSNLGARRSEPNLWGAHRNVIQHCAEYSFEAYDLLMERLPFKTCCVVNRPSERLSGHGGHRWSKFAT